ncbi:calcitonin receptor [Eurytemora carolleeae]|uniref:calcitonin receptor n=1 Tax=Eurytemora carolleeae TaxID=1294199 RepID=UPI000C770D3F|nr:calcitonin receptor [Eurytemora carolleeae]|eukprot:XP_023326719.1 calcitonin receptor-like [Eurytemora affinis]
MTVGGVGGPIIVAGLSLSLFCLLVSLLVFTVCRSLSCGRITMHKNMFLSLTLNNISWLLWYHLVLFQSSVWSSNVVWCRVLHVILNFLSGQSSVWSSNVVWCRVLHVILNYFMLTTYFWMLCEGTYLQLLLMNTFQVDSKRVRGLLCLGWGTPVLIVIPYSIYRQIYENSNCWMEVDRESSYFLGIPVLIVIIVNIVFLTNVIRILRSKLSLEHQTHVRRNSRNQATLKQAKAALFLVPILGVYFLLTPVRPSKGSNLEYAYEILSAISSSFQGFFVSVLLCFTNSEVINLVKQRMYQFRVSRNAIQAGDFKMNHTNYSVSLPRVAEGALSAVKLGTVPIMQADEETGLQDLTADAHVDIEKKIIGVQFHAVSYTAKLDVVQVKSAELYDI